MSEKFRLWESFPFSWSISSPAFSPAKWEHFNIRFGSMYCLSHIHAQNKPHLLPKIWDCSNSYLFFSIYWLLIKMINYIIVRSQNKIKLLQWRQLVADSLAFLCLSEPQAWPTSLCPMKCQQVSHFLQHSITACALPALQPTPVLYFDSLLITELCSLTLKDIAEKHTSLQLLHIGSPATKASERQCDYDYSNQRSWELLRSLKPSLPIEKHVLMHLMQSETV